MQKKSIIAIIGAVVTLIVASLTLVFTVGLRVSADEEEIELVENQYLKIEGNVLNGFTDEGNSLYKNNSGKKYCIEVPNTVTSIGYEAFYGCSGLTTIEIPADVTSIGYRAFSGCSGLTSIEIPEGVTSIDTQTFSGCSGLTTITFAENSQLTSIGYGAFNNCSGLTTIEIPASVTSIGDSAFYGCSGLTTLEIPEGVNSISYLAFRNCSGLTSIVVDENNSVYDSRNNSNCIIKTVNNHLIQGCKCTIIPNSVTAIDSYAFQNCSGLTTITIPEGVTSIGASAFRDCSGLTTIEIPANVTSIGNYAFSGCSGLTTITLARNSQLNTIGEYAFNECRNLTCCFIIPSGATKIGKYAFSNCINMRCLYIPSSVTDIGFGVRWGASSVNIYLEGYDGNHLDGWGAVASASNGHYTCKNGTFYCKINENFIYQEENGNPKLLKYIGQEKDSILIPSNVISISADCFKNSGLTSVTFAENSQLTSIGDYAFQGCPSLKTITIPVSVTSIGYGAFTNCSGLTTITFAENSQLTSIGASAFSGCSGLTTIEIPEGVTSIGGSAFDGCSGLTTIEIPEGVTSISACAFYNCSGLTTIEIPANVTSIGASAFYRCSRLTTIEIPEGVASIGASAFSNCSGLTTIEIPASVTSIGSDAFSNYQTLQTVLVASQEIMDNNNLKSLKRKMYFTKCNVKFMDGDTELETREVAFDNCATALSATKTGYTFNGWKDSDGNTFDFSIPIKSKTQEIVLTAQWEVNKYTVTFNSNGGSAIADIDAVVYDTLINAPDEPTLAYHTFKGWYKDAGFQNSFDFATEKITANLTLYAKWEIYHYTVTFNNNGEMTTQPINHGDKIVKPADPIKPSHDFKYWYTTDTNTEFDFDTVITEDITLNALWEIKHFTVTFYNNGQTTEIPADYGDIIETLNVTRENYHLLGWYTEPEFENKFSFTTQITDNTNLYANWEINKYSVTFVTAGSAVPTITDVVHGTQIEEQNTTRDGYDFIGWFYDENFTQPFNFSMPIITDTTLYAKLLKIYTVTFNSNGGNNIDSQSIDDGDLALKPIPTRTGYGFQGWFLDGATEEFDFSTPITTDIILTANWLADTYTIVFNRTNGTQLETITASHDSMVARPEDPEYIGHTFDGWYSDAECQHEYNFNTLVSGPINLYAKWLINSYNIIFISNGIIQESKSVLFGEPITKPTDPTSDSHDFQGWYLTGETEQFDFDTLISAHDYELIAQWEIKHYTVTFINGIETTTQAIDHGSIINEPNVNRNGYHLLGWYTEPEFENKFSFTTPITNNINLYVNWEINTYIVTFDSNGGSEVDEQNVNHGETAEVPTCPTLTGYTFQGWFVDTEEYDFETTVTSNVTLTAQWQINVYQITFDSNQGSEVNIQNINYNETVTKPENPTRDGYIFQGWYLGEEEYDFETPITGNITLTAKWEKELEKLDSNPQNNNQKVVAAVAGTTGGVAGVSALGTLIGVVVRKRRRK